MFDPAHPIPSDVWFPPYQANLSIFLIHLILTVGVIGSAVSCSAACLLIGLTGALLDATSKVRDIGDVIVVAGLYILFTGLLIIGLRVFWLPLWYEWLAAREKRQGVLRRGLFLTPDALVIRLKTRRCDVIPRSAVLKVQRWGARAKTWSVVYRAPDGKQARHAIDFPPFHGIARELPEVSRVRKWAGTRGETET